MSRGGSGGVPRSSIVSLIGIDSAPTRSEGLHSSPEKGSSLDMSLKSSGSRDCPMGPH